METTRETQNVSQQPDCLVDDYRPYLVVVDIGKPYSEEAADLDALGDVLRNIHQLYVVEDECPHVDLWVYDSIDQDITESQAVQEIIADIIGE